MYYDNNDLLNEYKKNKNNYEKKFCNEWIDKNDFKKIDNKFKL